MLMRMRVHTLWNGVPRDILFLIFKEFHRLSWIASIKDSH